MSIEEELKIKRRMFIYSLAAPIVVIVVAILVLVGWQLNIEVLKRVLPGLVAMNPITAICFILAASAALLLSIHPLSKQRRAIAAVLSSIVGIIGGGIFGRYIWNYDFWPDRLFFADKLDVFGQVPNMMAPRTSLSFLLIGLSLLLINTVVRTSRSTRAAQYIILAVTFLSVFAILGYAYGSRSLIGSTSFIPTALHTAASFVLLSTAILATRPKDGIMFLFSNDEAAGYITRRLLMVAVLIPGVLGWLRVMGQRAQLYDTETGAAFMVIASIFMLVLIIWISGGVLYRKELEVERSKDEFLGLATHQLQTPLTGIKLQLGTLQEGYYGKLKAEQLEAINEADEANEREIRIVQDLLNVAHADSGRMVLKKVETNLDELVADIIKEHSSIITQRKQTITFHADKVVAVVDPNRMRMAVDNLISNASKYTPDEGKIEVGVSETPEEIRIKVGDSGVGIAKQDIEKLFGKFTRLDNPLSQTRGGTGLGMYLVRKIIDLHKARIDVESEVGKGSTFTIVLPKAVT